MKTLTRPETQREIKSVLSLSSIFALRMLAIFMFIPIFTLYAKTLQGATPMLIGVAMGIYGLAQTFFQLPLGAFSDKLGRKPIIITGLMAFVCGSVLGAMADNIYLMIIARTLQGAGAVGSTLMAFLADLTSEQHRTKAMAAVGIAMGLSSALAMIIGPAFASYFGLSGVFSLSATLACGAIIFSYYIPTPSSRALTKKENVSLKQMFHTVLKVPGLMQLNIGIFLLHTIFTAMFYACPLMLSSLIQNSAFFYLPILGITFLFLFPSIALAERKQKTHTAFLISILFLLVSQCFLIQFHTTLWSIGAATCLFFIGFNFLESILPSWISKIVLPEVKGTAMSLYSCSQFFGIFIGGTIAGIIYPLAGIQGIFIFTTVLACLWLIIAFKSKLS